MTEEKRQEIVRIIEKDLENKNSLKDKKSRLEELSKGKEVQEYLQLLESIQTIERNNASYTDSHGNNIDSLERRVFRGFRDNIYPEKCLHELWMYLGSYYEVKDFFGEKHYALVYPHNQNNLPFAYKKYVCIECGKDVETDDENFECNHNVLADEEQIYKFKYYQDMYYQLLFQGLTGEEALEEIKIEFETNRHSHTRKRKQGE